jgi:PAS domain S-box-containing protein
LAGDLTVIAMDDGYEIDPFELTDALFASWQHACFVMGHGRRPALVSEAFCRLSGYTAHEFLALETTGVLSTDEDRVLASQALNRALRGEPPRRRQREVIRQDGGRVRVEGSATLLPCDGALLVLSQFWPLDEAARDAARLPQTPDADTTAAPARASGLGVVGERESLLNAVLDTVEHACLVLDGNERPLAVTDALCELLGRSREEFMALGGPEAVPLAPGDGPSACRQSVDRALAGAPRSHADGELLRADGERVPVRVSTSRLRLASGPPAVLLELWPLAGTSALSAA